MKRCFKCKQVLPLTEFYAHPQMADGHLGKCKECTKADSKSRQQIKSNDPQWLEKERERHRLKARNRRESGKDKKPTREQKAKTQQKHRAKYPDRDRARRITNRAIRDGSLKRKPCEKCGNTDSEAHHEDYSKPLDVTWLCPKHHAERHIEIRKKKPLP